MPSIDELGLMYRNLKQNGLDGLKDGFYWSSSQDAGNYSLALTRQFSDGNQYIAYKDYAHNVRAVRAF